MKILHTADWHLREKDIEECAKVVDFLIERATVEGPDMIIIAGDIFDKQDIRAESPAALLAIKAVSALADIASVAIIIGTPSHDGRAPEILRFARGRFGIHVASMPEQVYLYEGAFRDGDMQDGRPQAILTMIPQFTKQYFYQFGGGIAEGDQAIGQAMSGVFMGFGAQAAEYHGVPHILVGHWQVSGSTMSNGQIATGRDIEVSVDQMMLANPDLICLGHIHLPQQMGERTFYSGSLYAVNIGEDHSHGFYIHELDNQEHRFIETPHKRTSRFRFDLTTGGKIVIPFEGLGGSAVRIDVTAWQDEIGQVGKETILENLKRWGAESVDIRINAVPRETIRAAAVLEAETLKDEFREMAILRGETIDPEILMMAEKLEQVPGEELLKEVAV